MKNVNGLIMCGLLTLVAGCASTLDSFFDRPVVQDYLLQRDGTGEDNHRIQIGTLAVTAQRRLIVGNLTTGAFCTEPPPEAADSVVKAITAALKTKSTQGKTANAEMASNLARHVNQLYRRSHTVQLFRDAAFYLCVDSVNEANYANRENSDQEESTERSLSRQNDSYATSVQKIVQMLIPVLQEEIDLYYSVEQALAENPPQVVDEVMVCGSTASVGKASEDSGEKLSTSVLCHPSHQVAKSGS